MSHILYKLVALKTVLYHHLRDGTKQLATGQYMKRKRQWWKGRGEKVLISWWKWTCPSGRGTKGGKAKS